MRLSRRSVAYAAGVLPSRRRRAARTTAIAVGGGRPGSENSGRDASSEEPPSTGEPGGEPNGSGGLPHTGTAIPASGNVTVKR